MDWGSIIGAIIGGGIGSFGGPGTMAIGAGIGGGIGGMFGGGDNEEDEYRFAMPPDPKFFEKPGYPETEEARKRWAEKIWQWGEIPGYGAIAPDFGDIWERAKEKVSQYYWGDPMGGPGLVGKVKAGAAARGVAESPALETMISRMGYGEAGQLKDIATTMATEEAKFGEAGRRTWLENIRAMARMQKPGMWQTAQGYIPTQTTPWGDLASAVGGYFGAQGQRGWYEEDRERTDLSRQYPILEWDYKKPWEMPRSIV